MPRFGEEQDPLFRRLNASIGFDRRLWPQDVVQSRAHARALAAAGVLTKAELAQLLEGLDRVAEELAEERFRFGDDDEDIHMAIERRLTEIVGPLGGKLHTGRSRNDQVATDVAMFVRERAERALELTGRLMATLLELAERHRDWPAPGYTHMQRAQPLYLGHHLLAHFWALGRDARRFRFAAGSTVELPAGSGALAGLNWDLDREAVARELGFERPAPNSLEAVSGRDCVLDYLYAAAVCALHLSRLGTEIVLWSGQEFGFCEPSDSFASGSSIMPQKKNPDAAELLRGKAPRVAADLAGLLGTFHGLPLGYNKDVQEDKEAMFDSADNLELCLEAADGMMRGITFHRERLAAAAEDEFLAATDLADLLVREGIPFREAHGIVARVVRLALDRGATLSELSDEELDGITGSARERVRDALRLGDTIESKVSAGGTSSARVSEQLASARSTLEELGG